MISAQKNYVASADILPGVSKNIFWHSSLILTNSGPMKLSAILTMLTELQSSFTKRKSLRYPLSTTEYEYFAQCSQTSLTSYKLSETE